MVQTQHMTLLEQTGRARNESSDRMKDVSSSLAWDRVGLEKAGIDRERSLQTRMMAANASADSRRLVYRRRQFLLDPDERAKAPENKPRAALSGHLV